MQTRECFVAGMEGALQVLKQLRACGGAWCGSSEPFRYSSQRGVSYAESGQIVNQGAEHRLMEIGRRAAY